LLAELAPMGPVGPVSLAEVRLVLGRRLSELSVPPSGKRHGKVFIAPVAAARGLSFDSVFVPGLAEKLFPQKVMEDPLLRDAERRLLAELETSEDRIAAERLALRLAAGAARGKLVLSWPRIDLSQGRARVPCFYGLEVVRGADCAAGRPRTGSSSPRQPLSKRCRRISRSRDPIRRRRCRTTRLALTSSSSRPSTGSRRARSRKGSTRSIRSRAARSSTKRSTSCSGSWRKRAKCPSGTFPPRSCGWRRWWIGGHGGGRTIWRPP